MNQVAFILENTTIYWHSIVLALSVLTGICFFMACCAHLRISSLQAAATVLAALAMWTTRKIRIHGFPLLGLVMPALTNAFLVGWEVTAYIGGGFWLNALYVALGELIVMLTLGIALWKVLQKRGLARHLFHKN